MLQIAKSSGCPKDQVTQFITHGYIPLPWQWKFHAVSREADKDNGPVDIGLGGARGPGKALSLDTPIPTKDGWTTMGKIKINDVVFAPDGSTTKVVGISPVQNNRNCFEVIFSDGSLVIADGEHLWNTETKKERIAKIRRTDEFRKKRRNNRSKIKKEYLCGLNIKNDIKTFPRTTNEILDTLYDGKEINHSIDTTLPVKLDDVILPIDPYVLGAWLGDGHSDSGKLTCFDDQIIDEIREKYNTHKLKADGLFRIEELTNKLSKVGLLKNKHIPNIYLRSSYHQRLSLLQGLNDTDGYADKDGSVEFTNTNKKIIDGYFELVSSLGIKSTCKEGIATLDGRIISKKWRIRYTSNIPSFRLARKLEKQKLKTTQITRRRFIVEIRPVKSVPVKCITVDHPSHCFLVGKSFIPTHNSHASLSQVALDDCQRVPGLKCLFLRQTGVSAEESFKDLIEKALRGHIKYFFKNNQLSFPNGSKILMGGFRTEKDIDKYIGIEYDVIIVEELNQLTEEKYTKLRGSLRTSKENWRPRMYTSFNAGGVGHAFVKERYIIPFRNNKETETRFVGSTYRSNPFLNKEYISYLESITGDLGRAWREGDWDLFAGQFFSELNWNIHSFQPFKIDKNFSRVISIDYGYDHPTAVYWGAIDYDSNVFLYKEYVCRQKTYTEVAEKIVSMITPDEKIEYIVADPAIWAKKGNKDGMSGAEEMQAVFDRNENKHLRLIMIKANNDRINGWGLFREYLKPTMRGGKVHTKLKISQSLSRFWLRLPEQQHDPKRPEDLLKNNEDNEADSIRYLLMSRVSPAKEIKEKNKENRYGYKEKGSAIDLKYKGNIPNYKVNL